MTPLDGDALPLAAAGIQRVDVRGRLEGLRQMQEGGDENLGSLVLVVAAVLLVAVLVGLLEYRRRVRVAERERERQRREEEARRRKEAEEREEASRLAEGARRFGRGTPPAAAAPTRAASDQEEAPLADLWRMIPGDPLILAPADRSRPPASASWLEHGPEGLSLLLPMEGEIPLPDGKGWIVRREASGDVAVWAAHMRVVGVHAGNHLVVAVTHGPGTRFQRHGSLEVSLVGTVTAGRAPPDDRQEGSGATVLVSRLGFRHLRITGDTPLERGQDVRVAIAFPDEGEPVEVVGRVRGTERDDVGRDVAALQLEPPEDRGLAVIARHLCDLVLAVGQDHA